MIICRGTNETDKYLPHYSGISLKKIVNVRHNIPDCNKILQQEQVRIKKLTCFSRKSNLKKNGKSQT
jgi:hypothetical protein